MKFVTKVLFAIVLLNIAIGEAKRLKDQDKKSSRQSPSNLDNIRAFQIDESKNNSIINVVKNSTFYLDVKANPSTGYDLYLKNYDSINKNNLKFKNILFDNTTKLYMSN